MTTRPKHDDTHAPSLAPGSRLLSPAEVQAAYVSAYYGVLNEHKDALPFRRALGDLQAQLKLDQLLLAEADDAAHDWEGWVPEDARAAVDQFIRRWPLPMRPLPDSVRPVAERDVIQSLARPDEREGHPAQLRHHPIAIAPEGGTFTGVKGKPPVWYTGDLEPKEIRRQAGVLAARGSAEYVAMLADLDAQETAWKAEGRRELGPRHRAGQARARAIEPGLTKTARRAFLRFGRICPTWKALADNENVADEKSLRESVTSFAQVIGLTRTPPVPARLRR